ncbi:hypothetical protein KFL_000530240 [Klebsormidium nitens]|uniref:Uncharacterized protein n=1 Tax=Klebsormidium nitens TaxID=105231 RepID=A0A1Y1HV31_KLENI|nr:hypothetical protein KFL_000530240 [Klebsormidium nitens]|eukprot:GAQ80397.1 hypothetical protein KFL_000530240 [Klebsormidium nitens]
MRRDCEASDQSVLFLTCCPKRVPRHLPEELSAPISSQKRTTDAMMTPNASEAPPGFFTVIALSWRIFQAQPGSLLLAALPTVLALVSLTVALSSPLSVFNFLRKAFPDTSIVTVLWIALIVGQPVARVTMLAAAGVVWTACAGISARKVVSFYRTKRLEAQEVAPTRRRSRLVKFLKVLTTAVVCLSLYGGLQYGCERLPLWGSGSPGVEKGKNANLPSAILYTSLAFSAPLLSVFVASNTLLALPATILDPDCWGFASLLRSWRLARTARWQMVAFFLLTVAGMAVCACAPPFIVAVLIGNPWSNLNDFFVLADGVGLPAPITAVLLILGLLQKYAAALAGPGARFGAMLVGMVGGAAYFQVLWVIAYLAGLRRLELITGPPGTAPSATTQQALTSHRAPSGDHLRYTQQ